MNDLISMMQKFDLEKYEEYISRNVDVNHLNWKLESIYSDSWCSMDEKMVPMEVITHLADSYQFIPKRPDLAFNMCWKALNNSFNQMILVDRTMNRLEDQKGMDKLVEVITNESTGLYHAILSPFYSNLPMKASRFFANYILKSYIIEKNNESDKYFYSMYVNFRKNNKQMYDFITNSYGESYSNICNLSINRGKIDYGIADSDKEKSHNIIRSLSKKINDLLMGQTIDFKDRDKNILGQVKYSEIEKFNFILRYIIYATRCSNFHGNVSVRMTTNYSNKESFLLSRYIYNFTHSLLAISLHSNGYISDDDLNRVSNNSEFL